MPDSQEITEYPNQKRPLFCPETPTSAQRTFLNLGTHEALFGGAAGGGKSSALLMAALQYVDVPGYTAILFRRTYADLNLPGGIIDRFLSWMEPYPDVQWDLLQNIATFPSGATIAFGYLNEKDDVGRYRNSNFCYVGFDNLIEFRESDYLYLFSRIRRLETGPASKIPLRIRAASIPAPGWVERRFIDNTSGDGRPFVRSFLQNNPGIDQLQYRKALLALPHEEHERLLHGTW